MRGDDFRKSPPAGCIAVRASFLAQVRRARQEGELWMPHPATQADADPMSARISRTEVMEVRRTRSMLKTWAATESYCRMWDRWARAPIFFPFWFSFLDFQDAGRPISHRNETDKGCATRRLAMESPIELAASPAREDMPRFPVCLHVEPSQPG